MFSKRIALYEANLHPGLVDATDGVVEVRGQKVGYIVGEKLVEAIHPWLVVRVGVSGISPRG